MKNIVILGQIQHELQQIQLKRLVDTVKDEAGSDCLIFSNGSGLFSTAAQLENQVEQLFNVGIDVLFLGEQAISRLMGRNIIGNNLWNIVRPYNLSDSAPGIGIKLLNLNGEEFWVISVVDHSGKIPANPPYIKLDEFFKNKQDSLPVFINISGTDINYKEALVWKLSEYNCETLVFGSGIGYFVGLNNSSESTKIRFIHDIGAVVTENTIAGIKPDLWWRRNIEKIPITVFPEWGVLKCDYSVVFYNCSGKIEKKLHKTIKI